MKKGEITQYISSYDDLPEWDERRDKAIFSDSAACVSLYCWENAVVGGTCFTFWPEKRTNHVKVSPHDDCTNYSCDCKHILNLF